MQSSSYSRIGRIVSSWKMRVLRVHSWQVCDKQRVFLLWLIQVKFSAVHLSGRPDLMGQNDTDSSATTKLKCRILELETELAKERMGQSACVCFGKSNCQWCRHIAVVQERDDLRKALREHVITTRNTHQYKVEDCDRCKKSWRWGREEKHDPTCLAQVRKDVE